MDGLTSIMSGITIISIVIPIIITVVVLFFVFRFLGNLSKAGQATQQLLMTGVPATATVLQLEDGGMRVNDNPMVNVMLQVNSTQFGTYQAVVQSIVPMIKLAQVQPGQSVNVKVDPSNPQRVALELR
jgi:uncharacterized protein HemY